MQSIFPKQCTTKINLIHTEWDSWSLTFSVNNVFEKQQTICLNQLQIHCSCGTKVTTSEKKKAGKQTLLPQSLQKQSHCNNDIHFLWKK